MVEHRLRVLPHKKISIQDLNQTRENNRVKTLGMNNISSPCNVGRLERRTKEDPYAEIGG
jgi:hypothetical protein